MKERKKEWKKKKERKNEKQRMAYVSLPNWFHSHVILSRGFWKNEKKQMDARFEQSCIHRIGYLETKRRRYGPTDLRMDIIDTSLVILNVRCVCGYVTLCLGPFCCPPSSWHCFLQVCVCVFYCVSDFRRSLSLQHCTAISLFLAARATVHACVPARASACVCVLLTLVIVALLSL